MLRRAGIVVARLQARADR